MLHVRSKLETEDTEHADRVLNDVRRRSIHSLAEQKHLERCWENLKNTSKV